MIFWGSEKYFSGTQASLYPLLSDPSVLTSASLLSGFWGRTFLTPGMWVTLCWILGRWRQRLCHPKMGDVVQRSQIQTAVRAESSGSEQDGSGTHRGGLGAFVTAASSVTSEELSAVPTVSGLLGCQNKSETQLLCMFHLLILEGGHPSS